MTARGRRPVPAAHPTPPDAHRPQQEVGLEPGDSPGFLLWRVTLRWQRLMTAALRPLGLTHVQFVMLASAWWLTEVRGESASQRRLAEHAGTDAMMTSQVVRALEAKQLLARATDPGDARARLVTVTPAGADLARRAITVVEQADAEFFAKAGAVPQLMTALRRLDSDAADVQA